jgi:hypothetical protein
MQALQSLDAGAAILEWTDGGDLPQPARARLQLVDGPGTATASPPWQDKLQAVPAMRSALIPLNAGEDANWSKPFSLLKADFEPWLSYYTGYRNSLLFLPAAGPIRRDAEALDYPVRALLELKKVDVRLIFEPPVQIDAPVEYFDATRAPGAGRDRGLAESLARAAEAMHRGQLRRAQERGLEMGNHLHEALLGDGLSNLIHAWEKVWQRKPTPHELHLMLTTGRTEPVKTPAAADVRAAASVAAATPAFTTGATTGTSGATGAATPQRIGSAPARAPRAPRPRTAGVAPTPAAAAEISPFTRAEPVAGSGPRYLLHLAGAAGLAALIYLAVL